MFNSYLALGGFILVTSVACASLPEGKRSDYARYVEVITAIDAHGGTNLDALRNAESSLSYYYDLTDTSVYANVIWARYYHKRGYRYTSGKTGKRVSDARDLSLALWHIDRALELNPNFSDVYKYATGIYIDSDRIEQAKTVLAEFERLAPTDPIAALKQAELAELAKDKTLTRIHLENAIRLATAANDHRVLVQSLREMADLCEREKDLEAAINYYEKAIALSPNDAWNLSDYAMLLLRRAKTDPSYFPKALEAATKAVSIAKFGIGIKNLGNILSTYGESLAITDFANASDLLAMGAKVSGKDAHLVAVQALHHLVLGADEDRAENFKAARYFSDRAIAKDEKQRIAKAVQSILKRIKPEHDTPDDVLIKISQGLLSINNQLSEDVANIVFSRSPNLMAAQVAKFSTLMKSGRPTYKDEIREFLEQLLAADPNNKFALDFKLRYDAGTLFDWGRQRSGAR